MPANSQTSQVNVTDLIEVIRSLEEIIEPLKKSHETLQQEVVKLTKELEEKNRLLERKTRMELLGEIAPFLAHEIRNPIGGIELYASLLERDLAGEPEKRKLADRIMEGVTNLNAIVSNILSFTGTISPRFEPCEMTAQVDECLGKLAAEAASRNVEMQRVLPPAPVVLEADTTMLQQMFVNIVTNAMQAMEKNGRLTVSMQKTAEGAAEFVEVSFSDNGPGLTEEAKRKVFTPFFTGKSHGTGLGLAIAQRMIDAHHGTISAANNPDGGATFVVKLPLSRKPFAKQDGPDVSGKSA